MENAVQDIAVGNVVVPFESCLFRYFPYKGYKQFAAQEIHQISEYYDCA